MFWTFFSIFIFIYQETDEVMDEDEYSVSNGDDMVQELFGDTSFLFEPSISDAVEEDFVENDTNQNDFEEDVTNWC